MDEERKSRQRMVAALLGISAIVGLDRVTKIAATARLQGAAPRSYLGDLFRLEYALNPGAFLGAGAAMPVWARLWLFQTFAVIAVVVTVGLIVTRRDLKPFATTCAALIAAGAIGNAIDRSLYQGVVVDFMNTGIGPLRTGIFNVADVALTTGCLLLAFRLLLHHDHPTAKPPDEGDLRATPDQLP